MTTAQESEVSAWLAARRSDMIELLAQLVNTDSGTADKAGVDACGRLLIEFLATSGLDVTVTPIAAHGDVIEARFDVPGTNDRRPIVLLGHRDTVFPKGEAARRPFTITGDIATGPGVMDMKAGLVINAFVAAALARFSAVRCPVSVLITSDEEIASPSCRPYIEAAAREARAVFNSEPSRAPHTIVKGRKGGVFMALDVTGKAAHSGANHQDGASAIEELARKIQALHRLTDYAAGTTVNVGLISGGQTVNTVAPHARAEIDLRYVKAAARDAAVEAVRQVAEAPGVPGTTARLTVLSEFLPLEETAASRRLFDIYREAGREAGFETSAEFTGGCADSGLTAAQGCPTLCSVGPVGGKGHTPDEWLDVTSIVPSAQALALAVMRVAAAPGEGLAG